MQIKRIRLAALLGLGLLLAACQLTRALLPPAGADPAAAGSTAPALPPAKEAGTPGSAVTPTVLPALVLSTRENHEESTSPKYTIDVRWPALEWGGDQRVDAFNQAAEQFAAGAIRDFKQGVASTPDDPALQE